MQKLKRSPQRSALKGSLKAGLGTAATLVIGLGIAVVLKQGIEQQVDRVNGDRPLTTTNFVSFEEQWSQPKAYETIPASLVFPLADQSPEERQTALSAIATGTHANQSQAAALDPSRAKYLLAVDALALNRATEAIAHLDNLESAYPGMAGPILHQRARAYEATGDTATAMQLWQQLRDSAPNQPLAAEALYALGRTSGEGVSSPFWDEAIAQFPSHPRAVDIADARLAADPNQPQMLLIVAHHALYHPDYTVLLDRLTQGYASQLQPEDWEAIGYGYWEKWRYGNAGRAYAQAPATPLNLYRAGRGAHLDGRTQNAIAHYQQAVATFPDAADTGQAYWHLSRLLSAEAALPYLDQFYELFPDRRDEALFARARVYEALGSPVSAAQARQSILSQYSSSDTAADMRWERAQSAASQKQWDQAWEWAGQIVQENPESDWAPEAAFWVGKWAKQLGQGQEANQAFSYVLKAYPDSYYAWRSAVYLGWDVGNFDTAGRQSPSLDVEWVRSPLPTGSSLLQELYLLGEDQMAWDLWQVEFQTPRSPTVAQQFTDGVLNVGVGEYLRGIFLLENLDWRATPDGEFTAEVAINTPTHAYRVYPLPYRDTIRAWSHQHQLNPMLVTALMRQESRFQPAIKSVAGATGLMQVMPATAEWIAGQTDIGPYDLTDPQDSIKLGTWYLDYTHREYGNNSMFALASYNAGPGNVAQWLNRFSTQDLDVFATQIPFNETRGYVTSVFENYWNYLRLYNGTVINQLEQHQKR
ncbi:MAG: transglycosylase SLT domain-containing protein [Cyanothece sp. SIO2G6]|nr:transglycosylase SLT domain-containing protein [Cyanothece sp. SIO2G6]